VRCAAHPLATSAIIKAIADAAFRRGGPPIFGAQPPQAMGWERALSRGGGRPAQCIEYASWFMPGRKLWTTIQLDANVVNNSFRPRLDCIQVMEIDPLYAFGPHLPPAGIAKWRRMVVLA
jgi:hypothetical protein